MNKIATLEFLDQSLIGILPRLHLRILDHPLTINQKCISKCTIQSVPVVFMAFLDTMKSKTGLNW